MRKIFPTAPVAWTADLEEAVKQISRGPLGDHGREDLWAHVRQARRTGDARALSGWYWFALACIK
jgi:hypothetical protein